MLRFLYALLLGLFGAGIVHIVVLLLVPSFAERDAWSRLAENSGRYLMTRLEPAEGSGSLLGAMDPLFVTAACRFDLGEGMVQVQSDGRVPFWSASVYDRAGRNVYSFNEHAAQEGVMDFVLLTRPQMIEVRKLLPTGLRDALFVETDIDEGIVVIRAFAPDPSWIPAVSAYVTKASCELMR